MSEKQLIEAAPDPAFNRAEAAKANGDSSPRVFRCSPAFPQNHFPFVLGTGWEPTTTPKTQNHRN